jgi:protein-S-isoprenylcysteine O-methyltransferase Ste14
VSASTRSAALGSAAFLVAAPGVVAGAIPYWLTGWDARPASAALRVAGAALIAAGAGVLLHAFARFVREGVGTPAPVSPTERLVVGGLYRYVRNPMYLAVGATIVGQALALNRPALLLYAAAFGAAVATFVYAYEQPALSARYGEQYEAYRRAVPAWIPRAPARPGRSRSRRRRTRSRT